MELPCGKCELSVSLCDSDFPICKMPIITTPFFRFLPVICVPSPKNVTRNYNIQILSSVLKLIVHTNNLRLSMQLSEMYMPCLDRTLRQYYYKFSCIEIIEFCLYPVILT